MKPERMQEYANEIKRLKQAYADRIDIFLGMEIDYIPGIIGPWHEKFRDLGLDYRIGSVHFCGTFPDGMHWTVDTRLEKFDTGFREVFGGDAQALVAEYFRRVRRMVSEQCPNIVAHFDLIKLNNIDDRYFSEDEPWYRAEAERALEAVAGSGAILEVNLGAMNKGRMNKPYPSAWALERVHDMNIPITISADAHRVGQLNGYFAWAAKLLLDIGFRELSVLKRDGWQRVSFSVSGIG
jgi:histidinol-phosphatase (PHP family)